VLSPSLKNQTHIDLCWKSFVFKIGSATVTKRGRNNPGPLLLLLLLRVTVTMVTGTYEAQDRPDGTGVCEGVWVGNRCTLAVTVWGVFVFLPQPLGRGLDRGQATGVVEFIWCLGCHQAAPLMALCGHCGSPLASSLAPTARALAANREVMYRFDQVMQRSHQTDTRDRHATQLNNLAQYCRLNYGLGVGSATPHMVVGYLISLDKSGRTVVHEPRCPAGRENSVVADCIGGCPRRAKANTVRVNLSALRMALDDLQGSTRWVAGLYPGENPARSRMVDQYEHGVLAEQLAAGVTTTKAPLLTIALVRQLLAYFARGKARADREGDLLDAWWFAQAEFMLALLHRYADRAGSALDLRWGDLELVPATTNGKAGLRVRIGLSKSSRASGTARHTTIVDVDAVVAPVRLYTELLARVTETLRVDASDLRPRRLFVKMGDGLGSRFPFAADAGELARSTVDGLLREAMVAAGEGQAPATLHSFRASGARHDLDQPGADVNVILHERHWRNVAMLQYYTEFRNVYGAPDTVLQLGKEDFVAHAAELHGDTEEGVDAAAGLDMDLEHPDQPPVMREESAPARRRRGSGVPVPAPVLVADPPPAPAPRRSRRNLQRQEAQARVGSPKEELELGPEAMVSLVVVKLEVEGSPGSHGSEAGLVHRETLAGRPVPYPKGPEGPQVPLMGNRPPHGPSSVSEVIDLTADVLGVGIPLSVATPTEGYPAPVPIGGHRWAGLLAQLGLPN
jgi:integrase